MMPEIYIADKQTLDNVHSKVDAANTNINAIKSKTDANLDATISSRASQATVNTINTNVGSDSDAASASGSLHAKIKDLQNRIDRIGAGAGIKSVQRGLTVLAGREDTERIINISNVDMNKTFISHSLSYVDSSSDHFRHITASGISATVELRSPSSLIIKKGRGFGEHELRVSWEVIEFY